MPKQAETLKELAQVRADNRGLLNTIVGNQGTALGRRNFTPDGKPDGEPCIIVYVPQKLPKVFLEQDSQIPSKLFTRDRSLVALTDVVVSTIPSYSSGQPVLFQENWNLVRHLRWLDGKLNRLVPGAQLTGHDSHSQEPYFGTLGYCVQSKRSRTVGFLTNQHVGGSSGKSMYIGGGNGPTVVRIGVTRSVREHYPDDEWVTGIDEPFAFIRSDAAFIAVEEKFKKLLINDIPNVGKLDDLLKINLDSMDVIGMPVSKVGRTTGLTHGVIVAYGYGIPHNPDEDIDRQFNVEPANIYTDFLIAPAPGFNEFSSYGDSGSPIFTEINHKTVGVGLLWGGWPADIGRDGGIEDLTYGINLHRLLQLMGLALL